MTIDWIKKKKKRYHRISLVQNQKSCLHTSLTPPPILRLEVWILWLCAVRMSSTGDEDDNSSLFGSPPPSPVQGKLFWTCKLRNFIHELRLGSFERNIEPIALPGSDMSCFGLPSYTSSNPIPSVSNLVAGALQANVVDTPDETGLRPKGPQRSRNIADKGKYKKRFAVSSRSSTASGSGSALPPRDEILKNARERRRQLLAELECAKVELWEASIEGGILVHLLKDSRINSQRTAG